MAIRVAGKRRVTKVRMESAERSTRDYRGLAPRLQPGAAPHRPRPPAPSRVRRPVEHQLTPSCMALGPFIGPRSRRRTHKVLTSDLELESDGPSRPAKSRVCARPLVYSAYSNATDLLRESLDRFDGSARLPAAIAVGRLRLPTHGGIPNR